MIHAPALPPPWVSMVSSMRLNVCHTYAGHQAGNVHVKASDFASLLPNQSCVCLLQVLLDEQVPVITFYFGLPEQQLLSRIQASGAFTMGTATCLMEAQKLEAAGREQGHRSAAAW